MSGKLPETRCRFVLPSTTGRGGNSNAVTTTGTAAATAAGDNKGMSVLDFGRASVGVEVVRTVMLQNTGKSPAVFFVSAAELKLVRV